MVQDQALVASKHFLVETEDKNLADNAVEPPARWGPRWDRRGQTEDGDDRLWGRGGVSHVYRCGGVTVFRDELTVY